MFKKRHVLLIAVAVLAMALFVGCSEEDFTNSFQKKSKNDIMLINGQKYDISNRLYTKLFDCVKGLNERSISVDKDALAKQIVKAKEAGTYIHLEKNDGKNVTYISYKSKELLWGDIPSRTDATGQLSKKSGTYYNVSAPAKTEIKAAEENARKHPKEDEIIPK